MTLHQATTQQKKIATILAFISIPLSGFVTDIYLPSFPSMANDLGVAEKNVQLTLTCFFLSYGISQLFVGSLLDSIGRYKPSLIALIILTLSSLVIAFTKDIYFICLLRIIQGISISFVVVAKRAFFVDLYEGEKRKYYLSFFTIVWSCGPIIAPFLGGYLEKLFNWQANFYFLALYAFSLLVFELVYSGETLLQPKKYHLKSVLQSYKMMLTNHQFVLGIVALGIGYSVVMVFNISGPFVLENSFGYNSVVIGYCTLILGFSWMIGGILSKRLQSKEFTSKIIGSALLQLVCISLLVFMSSENQNLIVLISFAFIIHICSGFLYTIFFTNSMLFFPNNAGIAGGLLGGLVYVITSITSFTISSVGQIETQYDMSLRYLAMSIGLLIVVLMTVYGYRKITNRQEIKEVK